IARVTDSTATVTNSIVGTPSYMAPEQIAGKNITDKVDVFAWGCVMAFASTGNAPFGADSVPAVVHRVVSAPPDISEVPEQLRETVAECLGKDPDRRPTAKQLLMRLLGHDTVDEASVPTSQAVAEGEQLAVGPTAPSGPQYPVRPPSASGPQTPFPHQLPPGLRTPPHTGPQQSPGYTQPPRPMPHPTRTRGVPPQGPRGAAHRSAAVPRLHPAPAAAALPRHDRGRASEPDGRPAPHQVAAPPAQRPRPGLPRPYGRVAEPAGGRPGAGPGMGAARRDRHDHRAAADPAADGDRTGLNRPLRPGPSGPGRRGRTVPGAFGLTP